MRSYSPSEKSWKALFYINQVLNEFKISSMIDAGCGDFSWLSLLNLKGTSYIGLDCSSELIIRNKVIYKGKHYSGIGFELFDLVNPFPGKVDLILCRDVLPHLSLEVGEKIIHNFILSGSVYLLSTTFDIQNNVELCNGWRKINLTLFPYGLGDPIDIGQEVITEKKLGLWKIN